MQFGSSMDMIIEDQPNRLRISTAFYLVLILLLSFSPLWAASVPDPQNTVLLITVQNSGSLEDVLHSSGYVLDEKNVDAFLAEFMNLNPDITIISSLPPGTRMSIPLAYLKNINPNQPGAADIKATSPVAAEASFRAVLQAENTPTAAPTEKTEMGRFSDNEAAKAYLSKLIESGYKGGIDQQKDRGGQTAYLVYVLVPAVAGQEEGSENLSWSLLGTRGKHLHAALTLTGIFSDNAFNTRKNRRSDFSLILTPEVWLSLPRSDKAVTYGSMYTRSAGGHLLDTLWGERLFGVQASLYYRTDIPLTASKTSPYGRTPTHKIAGGLALIGNRLSLSIFDQFEKSYQEREAGQIIPTDNRNRYDANRFSAGAVYDTRNRFVLSIDYVNFMTNNSSETLKKYDRHDFGLTPAIRYKLNPKTTLVAEYTYYDVSYDKTGSLDSKEHYLLGGVEWRLTEKSFGRIKAGFESKSFKRGGRYTGFSVELQMEQKLTTKSQVSLSIYRKTNESMVAGAAYAVSTGARLTLSHMITSKLAAAFKLSYLNDQHKGTPLTSLTNTEVNDNIYQAGIEVQYTFQRWLRARAEYLFTIKSSSDSAFDYRSNTLLLGLTGAF